MYNNVNDENAFKLLGRLKEQTLSSEDKELIKVLKVCGKELRQYTSGYLTELLKELAKPQHVYIAPGILSLTHTAEQMSVSTSSLTKQFKKEGYNILYDRNKKYCKDRVITYIKVASDETK